MSRYIVVEEKEASYSYSTFRVYKKGWLFNYYITSFSDKEKAISYVLNLIQHGPNKNIKKVVFDSKKDLSLDIHF